MPGSCFFTYFVQATLSLFSLLLADAHEKDRTFPLPVSTGLPAKALTRPDFCSGTSCWSRSSKALRPWTVKAESNVDEQDSRGPAEKTILAVRQNASLAII